MTGDPYKITAWSGSQPQRLARITVLVERQDPDLSIPDVTLVFPSAQLDISPPEPTYDQTDVDAALLAGLTRVYSRPWRKPRYGMTFAAVPDPSDPSGAEYHLYAGRNLLAEPWTAELRAENLALREQLAQAVASQPGRPE